jgi:tRNA U55 pseudouridine synthase TruB
VEKHGLDIDHLPEWETRLLTPSEALGDLPAVTVGDETARGVAHGMRFVGGEMVNAPDRSAMRVLDEEGELLAVYRREGDHARPEVVLAS